ncbi:polysaccharide deacetylase family protein [Streptomyces sp. CBMA29]|uniref:polysaccharide deacetylase family protein n=1 Tax=Streptomyces sp. CBMA29 TaxID=1896314 RepID=UPI0016619057|nr:hydrolase [Streptomyces sp. CBMA29]
MAVLVVVIASVATAVLAHGHGKASANNGSGVIGGASGGTGGNGSGGGKGSDGGGTGAGSTGPSGTPTSHIPTVAAVPDTIVHAPEAAGKAVNITIDDGPDPVWTPKVLHVLKQYGVHATFCMIGPQAKAHPDLVRAVVAAGHRLCDHTVSHDESMDHKPFAYQEKEIMDAYAMIEEASGGAPVQYYRAPGGAFTPASRALAAQHGMRPLGWNVDTKDYTKPGVGTIVQTIKYELSNGPTILFHDGGGDREQTVDALEQILPWLKEQGYAFSFPKVN